MNTNPQEKPDLPLRATLREWTVTEPLPPRFRDDVWRRIEQAEARPAEVVSLGDLLGAWVNSLLPRPALALAGAIVLLVVGGAGGWAQARHESARMQDRMEATYLRAVDPYQPLRN